MFKKIEIWILYLVLLFSIPLTIFYGFLLRHELLGSTKYGQFSKTALFLAEIPSNLMKVFESDLTLNDRFPMLDGFNGTPNSNETYLLLSKYDGDLKEGVVELVDLTNFEVLHTWNPDINSLNKPFEDDFEFRYLNRDKNNGRTALRSPLLLNNGNLVFHHSSPLRIINACSNLVFQNSKDRFHHSIEKDIDGNIWVPSYIYPQTLPIKKVGNLLIEDGGFVEDGIVKLSPDGKILFEKSLTQIFIDNGLSYLLFGLGSYEKDPTHLNDIQPVNFDGDFWKKGDIFLSIRNQSMIILYRPSSNEIIWKGTGPFFEQHDVDILDGQRISVFNNRVINLFNRKAVNGNNEVIIYNFRTGKYSSYLDKSFNKYDVRTKSQGTSQILPNGDMLIEESNFGRTLYFNADGSLKWSHYNRAKNGNVFSVNWSRILYEKNDINKVKNLLKLSSKCNL